MAKFYPALLCLVLASVLLSSATVYGITPQELQNRIKGLIGQEGLDKVNQVVGGNFSSIDDIQMRFAVNSTNVSSFWISQYDNVSLVPIVINGTVVNGTQTPPPPKPIEVCGDGIDNDGDGLIDENCPIKPPIVPDKPARDVNASKYTRVCSIGDVDNNNGLVAEVNLANDYACEILIIAGDYGYTNGQGVIDKLANGDFTKDNTAIILGNHDSKSLTNTFNQRTVTYGTWNLNPKIGIFGIDANSGFGCSGTQWDAMKDQISSSDAWYNLAVVHQPFVTVKSTHPDNGAFNCYDSLFRANGVNVVLEAHNHNYQRFDIKGLEYFVVGTGTHDTGGNMYPLNSNTWNGFDCLKCITGTNGLTMMDFQIDDPHVRDAYGWFLDHSGNVKDKFSLMD